MEFHNILYWESVIKICQCIPVLVHIRQQWLTGTVHEDLHVFLPCLERNMLCNYHSKKCFKQKLQRKKNMFYALLFLWVSFYQVWFIMFEWMTSRIANYELIFCCVLVQSPVWWRCAEKASALFPKSWREDWSTRRLSLSRGKARRRKTLWTAAMWGRGLGSFRLVWGK
jgi:hypothetical protein